MSRRIRPLAIAGVLVMIASILFTTAALAHEPRDLGKYHVLVGWINEPAIQGQPNAISIEITDKATGQPVLGAEKTLKVEAAYGGEQPRTLDLEPSDDVKGLYTAPLMPTKTGSYVFTFTGSIDAQPINARFESGPNTFDDVTSPTPMEFPVQVPAAADLAQQTQSANATAQSALQRATLLGLSGIGLGIVGIILGIVALIMRAGLRSSPLDEDGEIQPSTK